MSEIELKFEVTPEDLKRLDRHPAFAAKAERSQLISRYFDTPGEDLRAAGVSLRVRRKGRRNIQTLKRSRDGELFDRDEWEQEIPGQTPDLSRLAETPVAGLLVEHASALAPRFTSRLNRAARNYASGGSLIEISVDKGEISAGDAVQPVLEIELELKEGGLDGLYGLAEALAAVAPIRLSFESKSERGYRLAAGQVTDPRKAQPVPLSPRTPLAAAFARIAESCLIQLAGNTEAFRRAQRPETLHQARIGLRRLRSAMSLFKPMVEDAAYAAVRQECQWAAGELDLARDLDVFIDKVAAAPRGADTALYLERLGEARRRAYGRALTAVGSARFATLLLEASLWVENGAWRRDADEVHAALREQPVAVFAADVLDARRKAVRKAGRGLRTLDPDTRHQLRIKAKKLRYAAEFFEPAFGAAEKRRRRFIAALKALQDQLGDLNDLAMAERSARQGVFGRRATDIAFLAGAFVGRMKAREPDLIAQALEAFADFAKAKPFWD